jgi:hypothetical protein
VVRRWTERGFLHGKRGVVDAVENLYPLFFGGGVCLNSGATDVTENPVLRELSRAVGTSIVS